MDISSAIGNFAGFGLGLAKDIYGIFSAERARGDQLRQQDWQNKFAMRQYDFAREQFDYQQHLNELQMSREDTSYQRKMADLQAAGLHPYLAVGGPGAVSAPMSSGHHGASSPSSGSPAGGANLGNVMQNALIGSQFEHLKAQIDLTKAEAQRVRSEARRNDHLSELDWIQEERNVELHEIALGTYNITLERHGVDMRILQNQLDLHPHQFQALLLDNLHKVGRIHQQDLDSLYTRQSIILRRLETQHAELDIAARQLNITRQELENRILTHDANIFLSSDTASTSSSPTAQMEDFVRGLGIQPNSTAGRIIRTSLQYIDWASDIILRGRARNSPAATTTRRRR